MRRVVVIDIGTHSILYLLAEKDSSGRVACVHQEIRGVRLGRNIGARGVVQEAFLNKAISVLKEYVKLAQDQQADEIIIVSTHVLRAAQNKADVGEMIRKETGLLLHILSGQEEAEASYRGATFGRELTESTCVVDIGGGSTEVILGKADRIMELQSIPVGAVGLTERFLRSDPPSETELADMEHFIDTSMNDTLGPLLLGAKDLIGVGGTVTTLAALDLGLRTYDPHRVDGHILQASRIRRMTDHIQKLSLSERKKIMEIDPGRADIILAGAYLLKAIMDRGPFKTIRVSDRGLRFGIAIRSFSDTLKDLTPA
jgi:exopolyphosphatase/guanosine-5'-triphosphate,3'-diphosphate pyrophosphatase